jgi:hypothetical protein
LKTLSNVLANGSKSWLKKATTSDQAKCLFCSKKISIKNQGLSQKKVLGPHALNETLHELKPSTNDVIFFGIQTDASNFKNKKYFPTTVQYYNPKMGIINKIIDFKENSDETAWGMERSIIETFDKLQLDVKFKRGRLCQ